MTDLKEKTHDELYENYRKHKIYENSIASNSKNNISHTSNNCHSPMRAKFGGSLHQNQAGGGHLSGSEMSVNSKYSTIGWSGRENKNFRNPPLPPHGHPSNPNFSDKENFSREEIILSEKENEIRKLKEQIERLEMEKAGMVV